MKLKLKDENGYPLNFDPSSFYQQPEMFFPIPSSYYNTPEGKYYITTWGRIYNMETQKFVPKDLIPETNRYVITIIKTIDNKEVNVVIHQLVCRMFVIPKPVISGQTLIPNHKDGIKWHNEPYNLEWVTLSQNAIHADQNNLIERACGEDNGNAALTDDQYREICRLTQEGYMPYEVNKIMNIGKDITNIVQKIRSGTSENIIAREYDFSNIPRKPYCRFSEEDVRYICQCLQDFPEMKYEDIINGLQNPGLKVRNMQDLVKSIKNIKNKISYKDIVKDYNF